MRHGGVDRSRLTVLKRVVIEKATRLYQLPPGLLAFARLDSRTPLFRRAAVIDLATINPFFRSSGNRTDTNWSIAANPELLDTAKQTVGSWIASSFGISIDERRELFLARSVDELLLSLSLSLVEPGDPVILPELAEPIYRQAVTLSGGHPILYGIRKRTDWSIDLTPVSGRAGQTARAIIVASPHHPTGRICSDAEWQQIDELSEKRNWAIIHDARWEQSSRPAEKRFWSLPHVMRRGLALYDASALFGLPENSLAFAAGHRQLIAGLKQLASVLPSIPSAGVARELIETDFDALASKRAAYHAQIEANRVAAHTLLAASELSHDTAQTPPWLWVRLSGQQDAIAAARMLYRRKRILIVPGSAFGEAGEGYLRMSLTAAADAYQLAQNRLSRRGLRWTGSDE